MEFLTIVAIVAIVVVGAIAAIATIAKVTAFYKQRFGFSLWSGVLLFVLALSLSVIAIATDLGTQGQFILLTLSAFLVLLTGYNDIRLAGGGWGAAALCLQMLFSLGFIIMVVFAVIVFVLKRVFRVQCSIFNSIFRSDFSIRSELLLLALFLHL